MTAVSETPRFLLTAEEAAKSLGIGRSTLFKLLASGELPSVRIGNARRISVAQLEKFVARLAMEGQVTLAPIPLRRVDRR